MDRFPRSEDRAPRLRRRARRTCPAGGLPIDRNHGLLRLDGVHHADSRRDVDPLAPRRVEERREDHTACHAQGIRLGAMAVVAKREDRACGPTSWPRGRSGSVMLRRPHPGGPGWPRLPARTAARTSGADGPGAGVCSKTVTSWPSRPQRDGSSSPTDAKSGDRDAHAATGARLGGKASSTNLTYRLLTSSMIAGRHLLVGQARRPDHDGAHALPITLVSSRKPSALPDQRRSRSATPIRRRT